MFLESWSSAIWPEVWSSTFDPGRCNNSQPCSYGKCKSRRCRLQMDGWMETPLMKQCWGLVICGWHSMIASKNKWSPAALKVIKDSHIGTVDQLVWSVEKRLINSLNFTYCKASPLWSQLLWHHLPLPAQSPPGYGSRRNQSGTAPASPAPGGQDGMSQLHNHGERFRMTSWTLEETLGNSKRMAFGEQVWHFLGWTFLGIFSTHVYIFDLPFFLCLLEFLLRLASQPHLRRGTTFRLEFTSMPMSIDLCGISSPK